MGLFDENIKKVNRILSESEKRQLFCLSTTANQNNPPFYFGPIRETEHTIAGNALFRDLTLLPRVVAHFDGLVETFLIDSENKGVVDNFAKKAFKLIQKSKVIFYKPNDIAVESLDMFLSVLVPDLEHIKIVVVGAGNIGSKISLKLIERGANVILCGRDQAKVNAIVDGLNIIKRGKGKVIQSDNIPDSCKSANVVLGCTAGVQVINTDTVTSLSNRAIIVDAGNGTITEEALIEARKRDVQLYSLSIQGGYQGFIENWEFTRNHILRLGRKIAGQGVTLVTQGVIGAYGDIIVNDLNKTSRVIGVCNGKGDVLHDKEAAPFLERFNKL